MLLFLKAQAAEQLALFMAPALIQGHIRAGHFVAPHVSRRHHAEPEHNTQDVQAPITFPHAVATDNPGHLSDEQFIQDRDYRHAIKDTYFGGEKRLSSRVVPQREVRIPLGAWRIDDMKGLHGYDIAQLRNVTLDDLILPELDAAGQVTPNKTADVPRYMQWTQAGMEPPPIEVVQTDRGKLRVTDGHRRVVAAKLSGRHTLRAWVSPITEVAPGLNDSEGRPLMTGLTRELAPQAPGAMTVRALPVGMPVTMPPKSEPKPKKPARPQRPEAPYANLDAFMNELWAITQGHPFDDRQRLFDNVGVEAYARASKGQPGTIHLSSVISYLKKGGGEATAAMRKFLALADKHQVPVDLSVKQIKDAGAKGKSLNAEALRAWYGRLGFVRDPAFNSKDAMIRHPGASAAPARAEVMPVMTQSTDVAFLQALRAASGDHFDVWNLAGPHNAKTRARIMGIYRGRKVPQSEAGVNALRAVLDAITNPAGDHQAAREKAAADTAMRILAAAPKIVKALFRV